MTVPQWFQREVRLINENYFCVWNPQRLEYQVRRWLHKFWRPKNLVNLFKNSKIVHTINYPELDERSLYGLRLGLYNARIVKRILHEVDEANRKVEADAEVENDYQHRGAAKAMWHHYKEPTIHLSGKELQKDAPKEVSNGTNVS